MSKKHRKTGGNRGRYTPPRRCGGHVDIPRCALCDGLLLNPLDVIVLFGVPQLHGAMAHGGCARSFSAYLSEEHGIECVERIEHVDTILDRIEGGEVDEERSAS